MTKRLYLHIDYRHKSIVSRCYTVFLLKFHLHLEKQSLVGDKMSIPVKIGIVGSGHPTLPHISVGIRLYFMLHQVG